MPSLPAAAPLPPPPEAPVSFSQLMSRGLAGGESGGGVRVDKEGSATQGFLLHEAAFRFLGLGKYSALTVLARIPEPTN